MDSALTGCGEAGGGLRERGRGVLVDVRDGRELDLALECDAAIVGINNRNLETLAIDGGTGERLLDRVPADVIALAESGVVSRSDVERVARVGADGILV